MSTTPHGKWTDKSNSPAYAKWLSHFDGSKGLRVTPEQLRWLPQNFSKTAMFHQSIRTLMGAGSPELKTGLSISHYSIGKSMTSSRVAMYSSDGDIMIVPQA